MTLYDIYDVCDIAIEGSAGDLWKTIKAKIGGFFEELRTRFLNFCQKILQSIRNLKDKIFKKEKSGKTIIYVSDMDVKTFNKRKTFLDDVFSETKKIYTEVSADADSVFTGEIIIENINTEKIHKNIDAIDVEFISAENSNTEKKKKPVEFEKVANAFEELNRIFKQKMTNSSAWLQQFERRVNRFIETSMNKIYNSPNAILRYIMYVGLSIYNIVMIPLRAIVSVLKYITTLASRPSKPT